MNEIWNDVPGYEGLYEVSNYGKVRNIKTKRIMKCTKNPCGYSIIGLRKNNKQHFHVLARIVANVFIPNPENKTEVNHIDGNKNNNTVSKLEWVNRNENMKHALKTGLLRNASRKLPLKIYQLDLEGNFIREWENSNELKEYLKKDISHIYACCRGSEQTAYGYKWKYKFELVKDCESKN